MSRRGSKGAGERPALFPAGEMQLRPSVEHRLKSLASRPGRAPTLAERRREDDRRSMRRLRAWGHDLATRFSLTYKALEKEREGVNGHYGICYEDGLIRIRLRHATTGRLLKESSLVDTLCHELAHLRHFDHGPRFKQLYLRILNEARELGYYRPGPASSRPKQLLLFDGEGCGTTRC